MFFKNYFLGVSDIIQAKYNGHKRDKANPTDTGELCEIFVQEFLTDSLEDNFKIFRGGEIINSSGAKSKQLDIVLCGKRTIKIFGDKGIYPIESVMGTFSITSYLSFNKLKSCLDEFISIPKKNYHFTIEKHYGEDYRDKTLQTYDLLFPYNCIFGFEGDINLSWIDKIYNILKEKKVHHSLWPDMIIVNKKGMIELGRFKTERGIELKYNFVSFKKFNNYGIPFSRVVYDLYNMSHEENTLKPQYEKYFNQDF